MTFFSDIKSKHLATFPLVTIGSSYNQLINNIEEPIHRISTQKINFDDKYYVPILINIPTISESIDV